MPVLKRHYIHIVFSWMLLANLSFSHIALNFFHHHEREKDVSSVEAIKSTISNDTGSQHILACKKHQESCKICDLHLFYELFADELSVFNSLPKIYIVHYNYSASFLEIYSPYGSGRAPPIHSSLS
ncbi:MAG TPA: hypothetical protein VNW99_03660 [Cytophagaceae bacterium]|jgi:hypothetical protein|nr:hypothetical protein [Cytophagaceae bacterium]